MGLCKSTVVLCLLVHSITFVFGMDTLLPNHTIGIGQTLVSKNKMFEMGFFSPGKSRNWFLGVWFKNTPDPVIWVANRNNPITDSQGAQLAIVGNRSLVIIWQGFDHPTDTWVPGLKLVDDIDAGVEKYLTSWRNSDDPSPGYFIYKIVNRGLPELVLFKGTKKRFRSGIWNGHYFSGVPPFPRADIEQISV